MPPCSCASPAPLTSPPVFSSPSLSQLVSNLYKEEKFDELLSEDPIIAKQREDAYAMAKALNRAITIVAEVTDARDV